MNIAPHPRFVARYAVLAAVVISVALAAGLTLSSRVAAVAPGTLASLQPPNVPPHADTAPAAHGPSQKATDIASVFGLPITNSMVVTWIVAVGLILFAQLATRNMSDVPNGAQNFLEWLVESLYGLLESI